MPDGDGEELASAESCDEDLPEVPDPPQAAIETHSPSEHRASNPREIRE
jgi:hypothetical protein